MRNGWQLKKLGDFISEYSVKNKCNETIPVYSVTNSQGFCKDYFSKEVASLDKSTYKIVPYGCFAYNPSRINVGSVDWQNKEERVIVSPLYTVFSVSENLNRDFLLYFIKSNGTMGIINSLATGTVRLNLKLSMLKEFVIIVPPLSDQQSIVSELDKINELIRLKKEQLKDYDNLAQGIFYEMFGDPVANDKKWDIESLGKVCDVRDGTHDSPQYLQESPYILITSKNLVNGKIDYSNVNYISEEDYIAINKRSQVDDGDIIMAMIGTIGNPIIVKLEEHKFCIKNVALIKFFNDSLVSNKYVHSLLNNESYLTFIKSQNKGGTQKFVALGTIRKLPIPIPPLSYQQQFAQRIELIEKQKAEIQSTIADLETLLASRMQYWFFGF